MGIDSDSRFHQIKLTEGNLITTGKALIAIDSTWEALLDSGLSPGTPVTELYSWSFGTDLDSAMDDVAAEFDACADVDYTSKRVTFREEGNCS